MFLTVITFVLVLSVLVLAHEFGHFYFARRAGVKVEEFGFGFPPRLGGIKKGDTLYSINWIPLGGFVKIKGESGEDKDDPGSFASKTVWQKVLILSAGVIMNFILAWALLTGGYLFGLPEVIDEVPVQARVANEKMQIMSILKDSAGDMAGLRTGDEVLALNGEPVGTIDRFRAIMAENEGRPVQVELKRKGETVSLEATPAVIASTGRPGLGVALVKTGLVSYPFYYAPVAAARTTYTFTAEVVGSFYDLLADLFRGKKVGVEFSGPVGIAVVTGEVARAGWRQLIQFMALLSVNLGVINILPIPALDGGRILFLAIGSLRRRGIGVNFERIAHTLGFAVLMLLVLVVTYKDVVRFGPSIWGSVLHFFRG